MSTTKRREDPVLETIGHTIFAVAFLYLTHDNGTDTLSGVLFLGLWCYHLTQAARAAGAAGEAIMAWRKRRQDRKAERKAAVDAHVRKMVEHHYSGPRKIVGPTRDGSEAIMAKHNGRPYEVHNHGPNEGRGLECPEYGGKDGRLVGACVVEAERQKKTLGRYWSDEEREERAASAARHPSRRRGPVSGGRVELVKPRPHDQADR